MRIFCHCRGVVAVLSQSRFWSGVETLANITIGYIVAILAQVVIFPLWGIHEPLGQQMAIGSMFTVVSVVRGYALRRVFNAWHARKV